MLSGEDYRQDFTLPGGIDCLHILTDVINSDPSLHYSKLIIEADRNCALLPQGENESWKR